MNKQRKKFLLSRDCLRHLREDRHYDGAVQQSPDLLAQVEQEVGQGRVEKLPFPGIHGEVSNLDAFCMALRMVHEDEAAATSRERLGDFVVVSR